jgi:hypothetical protein
MSVDIGNVNSRRKWRTLTDEGTSLEDARLRRVTGSDEQASRRQEDCELSAASIGVEKKMKGRKVNRIEVYS